MIFLASSSPFSLSTSCEDHEGGREGATCWQKCLIIVIIFSFVYLFASSGLSCGTQDLCCIMQDLLLWCMCSVVAPQPGGFQFPDRYRTCISCTAWQILNYKTTREVPIEVLLREILSCMIFIPIVEPSLSLEEQVIPVLTVILSLVDAHF